MKLVTRAVAVPRQQPLVAARARDIGIQAGAFVEAHDLLGPTTIQRTWRAVENLMVDELKAALKHHGESLTGAKEILIGRAHRMMLWQSAPNDDDIAALNQIAAFGTVPGSCFVVRNLALRQIEQWQQRVRTSL
jgi:hypothetical protein